MFHGTSSSSAVRPVANALAAARIMEALRRCQNNSSAAHSTADTTIGFPAHQVVGGGKVWAQQAGDPRVAWLTQQLASTSITGSRVRISACERLR